MERIHNFRTTKPIDVQLNDAAEAMHSRKEKEREENRSIVQVIFDVIRHLAKQNSAFRGHDESADSTNQGNFLEELKFLVDGSTSSKFVLFLPWDTKRNDFHSCQSTECPKKNENY